VFLRNVGGLLTTQCYNLEDNTDRSHRCENLKSSKNIFWLFKTYLRSFCCNWVTSVEKKLKYFDQSHGG
jgi:hypothetical protein